MFSKIRDYLELIRIPNIFTAVSGVVAGYFISTFPVDYPVMFGLVLSSSCLYSGGIVFNDYFDIEIDRKERPERPIPSGRILPKHAFLLGVILFGFGLLSALSINIKAFFVSVFIAAFALLYDSYFKKTEVFGAIMLGMCRFLNISLGMSTAKEIHLIYLIFPVFVGVYIFAVTILSKTETKNIAVRKYVKIAILSLIVVDAIFILIYTDLIFAIAVASLILPAAVLSCFFKVT